MLIRTEAPADILAIDALLKKVFPNEQEAQLVMQLRENARITLSLVACNDDGELIGHVLFSPVTLDGEDLGWQGLAPLAIATEYRQQGIAKQLINEGISSLAEFGYSGCFVLGDPNFYQRFGFTQADQFGFTSIYPDAEQAFQAQSLYGDAFAGHKGLIEYAPEFNALG